MLAHSHWGSTHRDVVVFVFNTVIDDDISWLVLESCVDSIGCWEKVAAVEGCSFLEFLSEEMSECVFTRVVDDSFILCSWSCISTLILAVIAAVLLSWRCWLTHEHCPAASVGCGCACSLITRCFRVAFDTDYTWSCDTWPCPCYHLTSVRFKLISFL